MVIMLLVSFFSWWYGRGWRAVMVSFSRRLKAIGESFSVAQLLRTLFAPWRRIITYPGASLAEKFQAWGDNLFSRCIGFIVRLFVLLAAGLVALVVGALTLVEMLVWPLLPLGIPAGLLLGVVWK